MDTDTSVPEPAPETDQPVAIEELLAEAAPVAESIEQQSVTSSAPDEEPVTEAVSAEAVLEDNHLS